MKLPLALLTLAAAATLNACQEVDESAPTHPRTEAFPFLTPSAEENAAKRSQEAPKPGLPSPTGEINRSSALPPPQPDNSTITADSSQPVLNQLFDDWGKKNNTYNPANYYPGPLPHLPVNPGTTPMVGSTPVPDTDWSIDHSWGQGIQLAENPHRLWPQTSSQYKIADVKYNPLYYFDITPLLNIHSNNSYLGDWSTNIVDLPWWYINTLIAPVLMIPEPPFKQKTANRFGHDPIYSGYLPEAGPTIPNNPLAPEPEPATTRASATATQPAK